MHFRIVYTLAHVINARDRGPENFSPLIRIYKLRSSDRRNSTGKTPFSWYLPNLGSKDMLWGVTKKIMYLQLHSVNVEHREKLRSARDYI